jgi:hypothetical protein
MYTYVSLHRNTFDPGDPSQSEIGRHFDSCDDGRNRLRASLQKNTSYVLVVTTIYENTTSAFSIVSEGEAALRCTRLGKCHCLKLRKINENIEPSRLVFPSVVHSSYSSKLNTSNAAYFHEVCGRETHYYVASRINVSFSGRYSFSSNSSLETNDYLYQHSFDPVNPCHNQILKAKFSWGFAFFPIQSFLQKDTVYILLVTTTTERVMTAFSILTKGVAHVTFTNHDQGEFDVTLSRRVLAIVPSMIVKANSLSFSCSLFLRVSVKLLFKADYQYFNVFCRQMRHKELLLSSPTDRCICLWPL